MLGALVFLVTVAPPSTALADAQTALDAFKRLAAAAAVEPTGATAQQQAERRANLQELNALMTYLEKVRQVMQVNRWESAYYQNYLQVHRAVVETGAGLAVLPEEKLCWHRAGLTLAAAEYRLLQSRVRAGVDSDRLLDQARAQVERFKRQYRAALVELMPLPQ